MVPLRTPLSWWSKQAIHNLHEMVALKNVSFLLSPFFIFLPPHQILIFNYFWSSHFHPKKIPNILQIYTPVKMKISNESSCGVMNIQSEQFCEIWISNQISSASYEYPIRAVLELWILQSEQFCELWIIQSEQFCELWISNQSSSASYEYPIRAVLRVMNIQSEQFCELWISNQNSSASYEYPITAVMNPCCRLFCA